MDLEAGKRQDHITQPQDSWHLGLGPAPGLLRLRHWGKCSESQDGRAGFHLLHLVTCYKKETMLDKNSWVCNRDEGTRESPE